MIRSMHPVHPGRVVLRCSLDWTRPAANPSRRTRYHQLEWKCSSEGSTKKSYFHRHVDTDRPIRSNLRTTESSFGLHGQQQQQWLNSSICTINSRIARQSARLSIRANSSLIKPVQESSKKNEDQSNGFRRPKSGNSGTNVPSYVYVTAAGTVLMMGYGYYVGHDVVPFTHRRRWLITTPQYETALGHAEYRQLQQQLPQNSILPPTHPASQTVRRVGMRIVTAAYEFQQQQHQQQNQSKAVSTPNKPSSVDASNFTFTVVRSDMANAFVLPGNHIFVFTGLFRFVQSEDELAVILGHEVAHNVLRHAGEKISASLWGTILAQFLYWMDPTGMILVLIMPAHHVLRSLPNSRIQEQEADQVGLQLAGMACYDPRASLRVFRVMQQQESLSASTKSGLPSGKTATATAPPPEFLSTHPSHASRLMQLESWMPQALQSANLTSDRCRRIRQDMWKARQVAAAMQQNNQNKQEPRYQT